MRRNLRSAIKRTADVANTDKVIGYTNEDTISNSEDGIYDCNIPERFICPLTLEVFTDPIMLSRGLTFERKAITEWLDRGNDTCSLTREPLGYRGLAPNAKLRLEVKDWK